MNVAPPAKASVYVALLPNLVSRTGKQTPIDVLHLKKNRKPILLAPTPVGGKCELSLCTWVF